MPQTKEAFMVRIAIFLDAIVSGLAVWIVAATDSTVNALSPLEYCVGAGAAFIFFFIVFSVFSVFPALLVSDNEGGR
jgi:hypothetical protein